MAGPYACRSSCWNLLPVNEDELAGAAPTEGSGTPTPTPIVSRAPISTPAIAFTAAPSSNNKLFKQFIKPYLEAQVPSKIEVDPEPCK